MRIWDGQNQLIAHHEFMLSSAERASDPSRRNPLMRSRRLIGPHGGITQPVAPEPLLFQSLGY